MLNSLTFTLALTSNLDMISAETNKLSRKIKEWRPQKINLTEEYMQSIIEKDCIEGIDGPQGCEGSNRELEGTFYGGVGLLLLAAVVLLVLFIVGYFCYRKHSTGTVGVRVEEELA